MLGSQLCALRPDKPLRAPAQEDVDLRWFPTIQRKFQTLGWKRQLLKAMNWTKKTDKKVSSKFAVCWSTSFQCSSKKSQQAASPKPKKIKLASWLTQTQGDLQVEERWPSRAFDLSRLSLCQKKPCFCWIVLHILRPLALARTGITVALLKVHSERKTYSQYIKYMGKLA